MINYKVLFVLIVHLDNIKINQDNHYVKIVQLELIQYKDKNNVLNVVINNILKNKLLYV